MTNKFHDEQALIPQVTGYQLPEPAGIVISHARILTNIYPADQLREEVTKAELRGRESMRQECLQECSAEATDNGTAQRIAKSIEGIK